MKNYGWTILVVFYTVVFYLVIFSFINLPDIITNLKVDSYWSITLSDYSVLMFLFFSYHHFLRQNNSDNSICFLFLACYIFLFELITMTKACFDHSTSIIVYEKILIADLIPHIVAFCFLSTPLIYMHLSNRVKNLFSTCKLIILGLLFTIIDLLLLSMLVAKGLANK